MWNKTIMLWVPSSWHTETPGGKLSAYSMNSDVLNLGCELTLTDFSTPLGLREDMIWPWRPSGKCKSTKFGWVVQVDSFCCPHSIFIFICWCCLSRSLITSMLVLHLLMIIKTKPSHDCWLIILRTLFQFSQQAEKHHLRFLFLPI